MCSMVAGAVGAGRLMLEFARPGGGAPGLAIDIASAERLHKDRSGFRGGADLTRQADKSLPT